MRKALLIAVLALFVAGTMPVFAQGAAVGVEKKSTKTNIFSELCQALKNLGVCSSKKK